MRFEHALALQIRACWGIQARMRLQMCERQPLVYPLTEAEQQTLRTEAAEGIVAEDMLREAHIRYSLTRPLTEADVSAQWAPDLSSKGARLALLRIIRDWQPGTACEASRAVWEFGRAYPGVRLRALRQALWRLQAGAYVRVVSTNQLGAPNWLLTARGHAMLEAA